MPNKRSPPPRRSTTKKYTSRPSPPYHANDYKGKIKRGNDGKMWISTQVGSQRSYTWKTLKGRNSKMKEVHSPESMAKILKFTIRYKK